MKKEFNNVIQKYKAGSPIDENLIWIDVSVSELTNEIINNGQYCSNYLCKQMLKEENINHPALKYRVCLRTESPCLSTHFIILNTSSVSSV